MKGMWLTIATKNIWESHQTLTNLRDFKDIEGQRVFTIMAVSQR
jgi:hypothetical protein